MNELCWYIHSIPGLQQDTRVTTSLQVQQPPSLLVGYERSEMQADVYGHGHGCLGVLMSHETCSGLLHCAA